MNDEEEQSKKKEIIDPLAESLGLTPLEGHLMPSGKIDIGNQNDDYEFGRNNIIDIIDKGNKIFSDFAEISRQTQEARYYEVLTNLMNSLIEANEKLMVMKKHDIDIQKAEQKKDPTTINQNLILTTADLQKMIENITNKKKHD